MLTVNRRHSIHKQFQATRDRQICRAWRVERHDKTGRQHRSARWVLAITGLRKPTCTGRMIKKCSLAVIGKVSAPASRIQEKGNHAFVPPSMFDRIIAEYRRVNYHNRCPERGGYIWRVNDLSYVAERDYGGDVEKAWNEFSKPQLRADAITHREHLESSIHEINGHCTAAAKAKYGSNATATYVPNSGNKCTID